MCVCVQSLSHIRLCDPLDCSMPASSVLHHLPEFAQTHVHWLSDAIQPSVTSFSCTKSFPATGSFPMSQLFTPGSQSIGVSGSASISPVNIQDWLPLGWTGLIDLLAVQGTLKSLLQNHSSKASVLQCSGLYGPALTSVHVYWKKHNFDYTDLFWQSDFRI